mmetsp:Transcript_30327/g.62605  ORF Transcript_30327/g.62605 Transcript_30327/m.62605 type:complete len:381 (-) Transcript_30327:71-1213(-)
MSLIKQIGSVVVGIALFIGAVGKFVPHWLMSLPFPLSVILWVWTGHEMPPWTTKDAWKEDEIDTWTRDGDLVVATGAKSGTTFMLYCTHQIRTKGKDTDDELFPDVSIATPWPDLIQSRGGSWAEQKERYNTTILPDGRTMKEVWDHPSYPFRIFKSHFGPPELPVRKKGGKNIKYMAMVRNGLDVAASMTDFYSAHTDEFRHLWGGFPPDVPPDVRDADGFHPAMKDMLPGNPLEGIYWGYVKSWWPYRDDQNVLLLHYSDVRMDLKGNVAKIANFLEVYLSPSELDVVVDRCSMDHMRKVNKFHYFLPLNINAIWKNDIHHLVKSGKMVNKGHVGNGKDNFSPKVVAKFREAEEKMLGHDPALLKWAREGGGFPPVES